MSRLSPRDKALVLLLMPIWAVCLGLSLQWTLREPGIFGLALSPPAGPDAYPTVAGFLSDIRSDFAELRLQPSDSLIRIGTADLRGAGPNEVLARAKEQAGPDGHAVLVVRRGSDRGEASVQLFRHTARVSTFWSSDFERLNFIASPFNSLAFATTALFVFLRATPTPMTRAIFGALMCTAFAIMWTGLSGMKFYVWFGVEFAAYSLLIPLSLRGLLFFPQGTAPPGRHRVWPWGFAALGPVMALTVLGPFNLARQAQLAYTATGVMGFAALVIVVTRAYRRGDPIARRQTKWLLFGIYCAVLPMISAGLLVPADPQSHWLYSLSSWTLSLIPLSLLVSIARFNVFDIDRLLGATASYNILLVVLAGGVLVLAPRLGEAVSGFAELDPAMAQVAVSMLLAAILIPAHGRLRPRIDRVFFKARCAFDQGIAELLPTLSACTDARELTERAGAGLQRLLRPEACVVYAGAEQSYTPVFAEGRAVPAAFEADSPLIGTLRGRRAPLSLSDAGRRPDEAPLGPFDRAALETLGAEVVVPVRRDDALAAFLCLGPKRSGDVYTSTDLSLLAAVAETVSHQLQRFDQDEVIREGREMQASLRRYVPGAVAEQLSGGAELASAEREVSVLFVDIRGYTGFAESRKAEEIFSTVNRYTEAVSQLVQEHGGSVVEFNGDGMMTIFGAPRELAHKERAAVEAGREIVEAVGSMPVEDGQGGRTKLSVGVGIATGEAFVGNIQAVDRMIWTAIGDTVNLAARLQSLTRDLDASLVIDDGTWDRAGPAAADFEKRPEVPIRGRREAQDVYALPLPSGW